LIFQHNYQPFPIQFHSQDCGWESKFAYRRVSLYRVRNSSFVLDLSGRTFVFVITSLRGERTKAMSDVEKSISISEMLPS